MGETRGRGGWPVVVIGKSPRPGRASFGPEIVVEGVTAELAGLAPDFVTHVEPRHIRTVLRLVTRRSTRLVHFLSTGRWSLLAPVIRLVLRKRVIATFHGYAPLEQVTGPRAKLQQMVSILQAKAGLAASDVIVSVSELLAQRTKAAYPGKRHVVIPNGLGSMFACEASRPRPAPHVHGTPLRLLIVGFGRHKGIDAVLEALEGADPRMLQLEQWSLTVVGVTRAGEIYLRRLRKRFHRIWDRVTVVDACPHEAMPAVFAEHDALLLWSTHESFGLVVLEAMACGVIPVVSDRVGAKDLILQGVNGFVVPLGDTAGLIRTIGMLQRGADGVDEQALRATARKMPIRLAAEAYRDLYRDVLGPWPRVCFVTNICPHYRVRAFELLASALPTRYLFFSDPRRQRYWDSSNPSQPGDFNWRYIRGLLIPGTRARLIPELYALLLRDSYDVLVKCINGRVPLVLSFLIARMRGKRFVLWTGVWHHPVTFLHRVGRPVTRWLYRHADAVVVYGDHVRRHLLDSGVPDQQIFIAPQAIDNEGFSGTLAGGEVEAARRLMGPDAGQIILFVGRMEDHKGVPILLRACTRLPIRDWTLVLIGEGMMRRSYEALARTIGLTRVMFVGHVDNNKLASFYHLATVLVLPSVTTKDFREPWGLVTNEAFSQGCPVVVTTAVGAAAGGMVVDGHNGLVVPERSEERLAAALLQILQDPELRNRLGDSGRRTVGAWTQERMVEGFLRAISPP